MAERLATLKLVVLLIVICSLVNVDGRPEKRMRGRSDSIYGPYLDIDSFRDSSGFFGDGFQPENHFMLNVLPNIPKNREPQSRPVNKRPFLSGFHKHILNGPRNILRGSNKFIRGPNGLLKRPTNLMKIPHHIMKDLKTRFPLPLKQNHKIHKKHIHPKPGLKGDEKYPYPFHSIPYQEPHNVLQKDKLKIYFSTPITKPDQNIKNHQLSPANPYPPTPRPIATFESLNWFTSHPTPKPTSRPTQSTIRPTIPTLRPTYPTLPPNPPIYKPTTPTLRPTYPTLPPNQPIYRPTNSFWGESTQNQNQKPGADRGLLDPTGVEHSPHTVKVKEKQHTVTPFVHLASPPIKERFRQFTFAHTDEKQAASHPTRDHVAITAFVHKPEPTQSSPPPVAPGPAVFRPSIHMKENKPDKERYFTAAPFVHQMTPFVHQQPNLPTSHQLHQLGSSNTETAGQNLRHPVMETAMRILDSKDHDSNSRFNNMLRFEKKLSAETDKNKPDKIYTKQKRKKVSIPKFEFFSNNQPEKVLQDDNAQSAFTTTRTVRLQKSVKRKRKTSSLTGGSSGSGSALERLLSIAGPDWSSRRDPQGTLDTSFSCPLAGGLFPDPGSCSVYHRCVHGQATRLQCDPGLVWNTDNQSCDWGDTC